MFLQKNIRTAILLLCVVWLSSCQTYYQRTLVFQQQFASGQLEEANKTLDKTKKRAKKKNALLFYLNKGVVLQLLNKPEESNEFLEKAYIYAEDFRKNYALDAASLLVNPTIKPYKGEDFEIVMIHYYKALNYLKMSKYDEALVECRRINIKLNELNDKYDKKKNRFKRDAFSLNLMGIIYEAAGEYNDAFIAYRNAYEAYQEDYKPFFHMEVPLQLKKDLLRSAYLIGFKEELSQYETTFGMKYESEKNSGGDVILFWNNGLIPFKDEWIINFMVVKGAGGLVTFENKEYGLSFPFYLSDTDSKTTLGDLKIVKVAFPKYTERRPVFTQANANINGMPYKLEIAQNMNEIAFKTLEDRMVREMSASLLRLAIKQSTELAVRQQNQDIGAVLSLANAVTEKADTRNWQTLPYSISYTRIPLQEGENHVDFKASDVNGSRSKSDKFVFMGKKNHTQFHFYQTFESQLPSSH